MLSYADPDYVKFLDALQNPEYEEIVSIETYLEQLEAKEREAKGMLKIWRSWLWNTCSWISTIIFKKCLGNFIGIVLLFGQSFMF